MKKVIKAPAKVNLYLSVNGKRNDGYHDLTMIMQPISLFDTLYIKIIDNLNCNDLKSRIKINFNNKKIYFSTKEQINLASNWSYIPTDDKNLVVKIVKYFYEKYSIKDKIFIYLNKLIPTCAGLGGGSSDAASILLFLNEYYKTNLSLNEMNEMACLFGSDISFFLYKKECICEGRGEIITILPSFNEYHILVVTPNIRVSTKHIFEKVDCTYYVDLTEEQKRQKFDNCVLAIKNKDIKLLSDNLFNDLEKVTCELYSDLKTIKKYIIDCGAINALMSGSGPTLFGIFDSCLKAQSAKNKIKSHFKYAFAYISKPIY